MLTLDDVDTDGKTIFLRVDMNCPVDSGGNLAGTKRIEEAARTAADLSGAKVVVASHQGRVGNSEYTGTEAHAEVLGRMMGREVGHVQDVMGSAAQKAIGDLEAGQVLVLDNLRLCAEENYEFSPQDAARTVMVRRLAGLFDACVLDSFSSAHRSHPSLVGFAQLMPACAGRTVEREVGRLDRIMTVAKAPHAVVLGGSKVYDRLEAIRQLIKNGRADHVLLAGVIGNVFLRAQGRIRAPLGIAREEEAVSRAHKLIGEYPDVFSTPVDVAVDKDGERLEMDVRDLGPGEAIFDLGPKTIDHYQRIISGAGTVFMSGPAGNFESEQFNYGTRALLEGVASSMATTIVSGGHLSHALKEYGLADKVDHVSTAGGALVLYLTGKRLPMIRALEDAASRQ